MAPGEQGGGLGLGEGRMRTSTAPGGGRQPRSETETGGGVSWLLLAPSVGFLHIIYRSLDSNQGKLAHTWGRPGLSRWMESFYTGKTTPTLAEG